MFVVVKNTQPCRFLKSSGGTSFIPLSDLCAIFFLATGFWSQSRRREERSRGASVKTCMRPRINCLPLNSLLYLGFEFSFPVSKAALLSVHYTALPATYTYTEWGVQGSTTSTVLPQRENPEKSNEGKSVFSCFSSHLSTHPSDSISDM